MLHQTAYDDIRDFVLSLNYADLKPCITLVRYGIVPSPHETALWSKLPDSLLSKLFSGDPTLTQPSEIGRLFFEVSTNPLISSIIISLALSVKPTAHQIKESFKESVSKEVKVMESSPRSAEINWDVFFNPIPGQCFATRHQRFDATPQILQIHSSFKRFRSRLSFSRIWPYATTRGISKTSQIELLKTREIQPGVPLTNSDQSICSLDIVRHFIHHGVWISGCCELKQKWYPHGLSPRTYFAQGGDAIRVSSYLRSFFNDFTDTYIPTERFSRVDGSRLECPPGGHFFIYDLTSFTSNFHEQEPFLRSMASFFRETTVFLIGPNLSLIEQQVGDLIDEYCDIVNVLPAYRLNKEILDIGWPFPELHHRVAGFLGVPGNIASCTLAHGISVGASLQDVSHQSAAGDDGNAGVTDISEPEVIKTVKLLGTFHDEKGSSTKHTPNASYLKRRFEQVGLQGRMYSRVDFPLLGAVNTLESRDLRFPKLSEDRGRVRKSVASSTAKVFRDLFAETWGEIAVDVAEFALAFLSEVYSKAGLPRHGMVRKMYGSDLESKTNRIEAAVVFPIHERYLRRDPDLVLCEEFLPWSLEVPIRSDVELSFHVGEGWDAGQSFLCRSSRSLEQLVRLGYVVRKESERKTVYGVEAREYFRRIVTEDFREQEFEYEAVLDMSAEQLNSIGLSGTSDRDWRKLFGGGGSFHSNLSFRRQYEDFDLVVDTRDPFLEDIGNLY
jgi:hypothetical protein